MYSVKQNICGAILAAGLGQRIKPLTSQIPKPLLPVGNKPIIQFHIEHMKSLGICNIYIVVGHLKERIIKFLKDGSSLGVKINYLEQKKNLGIAHAVGQLEPYINQPFLLTLGDIFFTPKNLGRMIKTFFSQQAKAVLAVKKEPNLKAIQGNFSVTIKGKSNKKVVRVIEKPRHPNTNLKGCGLYLFDPVVFDAIRNTPRTAMRDEYEITTTIQTLVDNGYPVYAVDVIKEDINVTFPCDLWECNQIQLRKVKKKAIVDPTAKFPSNTQIINSVIGKNVTIIHPITIKNSVILEKTKINSRENLYNCIVTPNSSLACGNSRGKS